MWSIGVIMYILLCGFMPFKGQNFEEISKEICAGKINFKHKEFNRVSEEGKDLIKNLI